MTTCSESCGPIGPHQARFLDTIAYLIYGGKREYHLELSYSVLSAVRFLHRNPAELRIVLVTDELNRRLDLPIENIVIDNALMRKWRMDGTYNHAAKVHALRHVMDQYGGRVMLVDTDTIFLAHPIQILERVGPGHALMHEDEGPLGSSAARAEWAKCTHEAGGEIAGYEFTLRTRMFNSGLVGVDASARPLLDEVLAVLIQLNRVEGMLFTAEQLAFSMVLSRHGEVAFCPELVSHYWGGPRSYYHFQFANMFPDFSAERFAALVENPPTLRRLPPRRLRDVIASRFLQLRRGGDKTYAFAWLAYRSALAQRRDAAIADIWACIALNVLTYGVEPTPDTLRDFSAFQPEKLEGYDWMTSTTRDRWRKYWADLGALTQLGQRTH